MIMDGQQQVFAQSCRFIMLLFIVSQPRERGRMRVHMLQNIQIALNFLKHRKVRNGPLFVFPDTRCPSSRASLDFHKRSILTFSFILQQIKLVNIRPDDIVDGNPKLTLGLIWTIILHYQVQSHEDHECGESCVIFPLARREFVLGETCVVMRGRHPEAIISQWFPLIE